MSESFSSVGGDFGPGSAPAGAPLRQPPGTTEQAPGGGNAFFAGLEELFTSPTAFVTDAVPGGNSGYIPPAKPGGGSAFVAGLEEAVNDPSQFLKDSPLPSGGNLFAFLAVAVVGILGVAYIAHKFA